MTNTIYLVRHGQTNWNILGKTQGHGNSNLTEKGINQAKDLAESMIKYPIDYSRNHISSSKCKKTR